MEKLDHPLEAEVQAVRKIIMNVDKRITEEIKWAAPTFSYKGYNVSALEGAVKEWIRLKDRES